MKKVTLNDIKELLESRISEEDITSLKEMPPPIHFKDIAKATKRIAQAIREDETINIVGDYDADGVVSTAIMVEFFTKAVGVEVNYIIPNRFTHGYGISAKILDDIYEGIIITVDNGISAVEAAEICKQRGLDLIITDHHTVGENIPNAYAIVNPKQVDCEFPFSDICGANVAWYLCASIKKELNLQFNLMEFFDLLTIAIVADVMPMKSLNKTIVKRGLQELSNSSRPAIVAIKEKFGLKNINEEDIGFKIAPLINCAGRMEDATIALEFLLSFDEYEANEQLEYLIELNENRKKEQLTIFEEAKEKADGSRNVVLAYSDSWNEGIIGIVAAKLCEKYKKPSFVFRQNGLHLKGSGRGNGEVNLYHLLSKVSHLLTGFGGHKGAAGLSLKMANFEKFKEEVNQAYLSVPKESDFVGSDFLCEIDFSLVGSPLFNLINSFRPFGLENSLPIFKFSNLKVKEIKIIGKNKEYKKLLLDDGISTLEALVFVDIDSLIEGDNITILATIDKNEFRNETTYNLLLKEIV
ncbi:MAG: single-stranded-DNA-specific exonuclease RecJ [Arcobacteraceae bacterium]|jgi:single-stranded-DNA-specific exonuclease|nr:single-stranded-DNA-specific exonuclease RecJ [Arcobacteraceae bacterium]